MKSRSEITVRYAETDQMGVVYHGNYFTWFEIGRTTLLKEIGYSYKELEKSNIMLPVIDVSCKYIDAAKYDDVITIESTVEEIKGVRITFSYNLYRKDDNKLLAKGTTTHAFVTTDFKPINFKKYYSECYEKLVEYCQ
ncbi:acyl-CoA thioesterase [Alkaliphilus peptidifermentans]|uniref:Acyl-CoA thioester hydrolase n=1 Tax=Alkaliphilus peptidifermentans DSM 18978 TaxID=1120976 RepID=A0A1G5KYG6_9FIRM|nr:thioesterase family protein [Alkaliphilus peptidifermentans]SCZ05384.1 acyl-CoA thioester hydrolase [Alkaliphilus peptidifermentans DSM 18978]